jgi:hypothetical protein
LFIILWHYMSGTLSSPIFTCYMGGLSMLLTFMVDVFLNDHQLIDLLAWKGFFFWTFSTLPKQGSLTEGKAQYG